MNKELEPVSTGGGCEGLAYHFKNGHALITDVTGLHLPKENKPYLIGFYKDDEGMEVKIFEFPEYNEEKALIFIKEQIPILKKQGLLK